MTEEEKKEFEDFLQWKKEKEKREKSTNQFEVQPVNFETKDETLNNIESDNVVKHQDTSSDPEPKTSNNGCIIFVGAIAVIFLLFLFMIGITSNKQSSTELVEDEEIAEVVDTITAPSSAIAEVSKKTWDFSISKDDMTDTKNIWAKITSENYISQEFPYEGYTYASITVRYMKKYGYDVIIEITKGQISGSEYRGTDYITARFDDGAPQKYHFNEASDGSSEIVFIRNKSDFIRRCKKAKDIKIDLPLYKGGRPVFTFHVDEPLVWRTE
ncbi:MAG: hypothetical protein K6D91_07995 [Prevotella sp.]|nr:hypothetical protein [Prevotella sp.]